MNDKLKTPADAVLAQTVAAAGGAPGVVAMVTDRNADLYEGAAGRRELGKDQPTRSSRRCAASASVK